eukprot:1108963-Pleurochrysis_carterae.AAC.2
MNWVSLAALRSSVNAGCEFAWVLSGATMHNANSAASPYSFLCSQRLGTYPCYLPPTTPLASLLRLVGYWYMSLDLC